MKNNASLEIGDLYYKGIEIKNVKISFNGDSAPEENLKKIESLTRIIPQAKEVVDSIISKVTTPRKPVADPELVNTILDMQGSINQLNENVQRINAATQNTFNDVYCRLASQKPEATGNANQKTVSASAETQKSDEQNLEKVLAATIAEAMKQMKPDKIEESKGNTNNKYYPL